MTLLVLFFLISANPLAELLSKTTSVKFAQFFVVECFFLVVCIVGLMIAKYRAYPVFTFLIEGIPALLIGLFLEPIRKIDLEK